jgi:hypothetical protein
VKLIPLTGNEQPGLELKEATEKHRGRADEASAPTQGTDSLEVCPPRVRSVDAVQRGPQKTGEVHRVLEPILATGFQHIVLAQRHGIIKL